VFGGPEGPKYITFEALVALRVTPCTLVQQLQASLQAARRGFETRRNEKNAVLLQNRKLVFLMEQIYSFTKSCRRCYRFSD
jgi:hypothetical protein